MKRFLLYLFAITTFAACSKSDDVGGGNNNETPKQPEITLSATASNFATDGGSSEITFTSSATWTAEVINSRADAWCSVNPTSGAAGDAKITVTTTANDTPDDRSASIVIKAGTASKTITVSQKQKDALTVTASKFEVGAEGGEVSIEVKANIDFEYTIEESAKDWVEYKTTRALRTSNLVFDVKENDDTDKREAKITIKSGEFSEDITIYQAGAEPTIVISQNEYVVSSDGDTIAVDVASNVDVAVELPADADWISENTTRGMSTNTFYFDIAPSEEYDQRTADIKFTNKENNLSEVVKIVQTQKDAIVLAENEYVFGVAGGNLDFEILTNVDITISISDDAKSWIKQVESRGLEKKALYFNVSACSAEEDREGTITISGGNATQTIIVKQSGLKEMLEKEREALIAFYNATGGDNWTNNENWCSDRPLDEWYGVYTVDYDDNGQIIFDGEGRVVQISLGHNNLTGSINRELDDLSELRLLDIPSNNLSGSLVLYNDKLRHLGCWQNKFTSIDVSELINLERFTCFENELTRLDVSNNVNLLDLQCGENQIQTLNIGNISKLWQLSCASNPIKEINTDNLSNLEWLDCYECSLTQLSLQNCPNLISLSCIGNNLTSLDVSNNPKLETILCSDNNIGSIDFSNNPLIETMWIQGCQLTSLDVSKLPNLQVLLCNNNELEELDVSHNPELNTLWCFTNKLTSLNTDGCTKLETLLCYINNLSSINVSDNVALNQLMIAYNNLTQVDVSNLTKLEVFYAGNNTGSGYIDFYIAKNDIKEFDLSKNIALKEFSCYDMNVTSITVSDNTELNLLECSANPIAELNLSKNPELKELWAHTMALNELDVSDNLEMEYLICFSNPYLTKIYIDPTQTFEYVKDGIATFYYKDGSVGDVSSTKYESTDYSRDGEVKTLQKATEGKGIDLVLMGDAYSDRLIADGTYDQTMQTAMEKFFEVEPYKSFRDYFNVYSVTAVSKNEVYTDTSETAFAGYFGAGTEVGGNDQRAFYYTEKAVGEEGVDDALTVVMMNSTSYAGTCYMYSSSNAYGDWGYGASVSYFPVGADDDALAQVLHHEAGGHGFSKLADEYAYENMGQISQDEIEFRKGLEPYGWYRNVDFTNDPAKVKWNHFLTDSRYANDGLGVYEGAFTYWTGAYRPTMNSIMNTNVGGFNAPSREAIYYRIHKLAYGADWKYDYEEFVEWDAKNRATTTRGVPYRLEIPEDFKPLHPPVVMKKSWKEATNNAPKKTVTRSSGNAGSNLQKVISPSGTTYTFKPTNASASYTTSNGRTVTVTTDVSGMSRTGYNNRTKK